MITGGSLEVRSPGNEAGSGLQATCFPPITSQQSQSHPACSHLPSMESIPWLAAGKALEDALPWLGVATPGC